jgi:hypothetical protein
MTTLSARYVRQPRQRFVCDYCERSIVGPYIRLYGNPDYGPMYTLRLHAGCMPSEPSNPKERAALERAKEAV